MGKDGGPAFPVPEVRDADLNGITEGAPGMSLRDWFAGQFATLATVSAVVKHAKGESLPTPEETGIEAYKFADAMLAAREASNG